ncbi:M20/M25/M40 family metallo-hydrolase [Sporomusa sp.]|uniref:M20/M25/M40 family metallo-hydrolase n=1 Tax=Sporomusa sp. TaxID=2078658 RepID=UPI002B562B74|nr:M20/M25/M40 family metallo-hydrolase [Sporomusa sp.]HWR42741.1 M20/M25/M40 family metallo-hydrolase [Sporomusa sp.]
MSKVIACNLGERIKEIAVNLTRTRSVVGTKGEIEIAEKIYNYLKNVEYFRNHPDHLRLLPVKNDELGRKIVLAFVEGSNKSSNRTILSLGHIDTAGIEDFGELKEYADQPDVLKEKLKAIKFCEEILAEIHSPDWIFGRGIFDMKTGVAALMVMLEEFSQQVNELDGNIVFVGVPDEEGNSGGMLSCVEDLEQLARDRGWEFAAAIDTDYMTSKYPGDENKYVYIGTVGKLLPCFYLYGEETHVGEAFNGLDANLLASEVVYQMDLSTDLCDIADGEVTLPPITLGQRDLRTEYSAQTTNSVNLYFNYATHSSQPGEVLAKCKAKAEQSFENVIKRLNEEYEKYCKLANIPHKKLPWKSHVLTYEELYQQVKKEIGEEIDRIIAALIVKLKEQGVDDREFSLAIVQEVHKNYSDQNAKIVVYFSPPYYPHIFVQGYDEKEKTLLTAVEQAVTEVKAQYDYKIVLKKFFPYISDLSYCSISKNQESIANLTSNMPAWPHKYSLPVRAIQNISMPVVNIGPFGKDAHKLSERLCTAYSFDAMPQILYKTMQNLLK